MTGRSLFSGTVLALLVGVSPLAAQGRDTAHARMGHAMGSQGSGQMQGMCTLMSAMHEGPAAALAHADHLNLTQQQRTRLETAKTTAQRAHDAAMEQSRAADRELATVANAERVNETLVRNSFRRMADAHAQAAAAMLRARAETRATLTEQQRTQLAQLTSARGGMAMGGRQPMRRDSGMAHQGHQMGRDSMVRMTPRQPTAGDSGRTMPQGQRMMGDSTARGGMAGGHMGMMGMMMMMHCGTGPAPDSARAHQH